MTDDEKEDAVPETSEQPEVEPTGDFVRPGTIAWRVKGGHLQFVKYGFNEKLSIPLGSIPQFVAMVCDIVKRLYPEADVGVTRPLIVPPKRVQ